MPEDVQPSHNTSRLGEPALTDRIKGGVIITVLALVLFLATFYVSSPTVPRVLTILVAVVGIAVAAGLVPVRSPQDFYGGLALVLLATFALIASAELPGQRGFAFGPGTAPRLFAGALAFMGAAVALVGVLTDGPRIEKYKIRGPALVIVGISLFAALIRPFGLVIATYLAFIISITGSKEMRWIESVIAATVMTLGCVLLFVYLLNLPFQLWPQSNAPQLLFNQFADIFNTILLLIRKFVPGL
jgi:putative tricarboxylic transport membrane protein